MNDKDGTYTYSRNTANHTHIVDLRDKIVKDVVQKAQQNAKNTNASSRDLFASSLSGLSNDVISQMPNANAFGKNMRDQRKGKMPPAPKSLADVVLSDVKTTTGEEFLMFDSNEVVENDPENRIIMFSTKTAMDFLATCNTIFMDGNFTSGPVLFEQMYTIHGKYFIIYSPIL